jgi:hypothetical protein
MWSAPPNLGYLRSWIFFPRDSINKFPYHISADPGGSLQHLGKRQVVHDGKNSPLSLWESLWQAAWSTAGSV